MRVTVTHVNVPALSTIGTCTGFDEDGNEVTFAADHRPAYDIGEAIEAATDDDELPVCEVEDWQILSSTPA